MINILKSYIMNGIEWNGMYKMSYIVIIKRHLCPCGKPIEFKNQILQNNKYDLYFI